VWFNPVYASLRGPERCVIPCICLPEDPGRRFTPFICLPEGLRRRFTPCICLPVCVSGGLHPVYASLCMPVGGTYSPLVVPGWYIQPSSGTRVLHVRQCIPGCCMSDSVYPGVHNGEQRGIRVCITESREASGCVTTVRTVVYPGGLQRGEQWYTRVWWEEGGEGVYLYIPPGWVGRYNSSSHLSRLPAPWVHPMLHTQRGHHTTAARRDRGVP